MALVVCKQVMRREKEWEADIIRWKE